ncbi:MAG: S8 family serine peptidase [Leptolyngbya sp. BL-A-14]
MLPDVSTRQTLVHGSTFNPGVSEPGFSTGTLTTTPFDRYLQNNINGRVLSSYRPGSSSTDPLPIGDVEKAELKAFNAIAKQGSSRDEDGKPGWIDRVRAAIEQKPLTSGTYSVEVNHLAGDSSHVLSVLPAATGGTLATATSLVVENTPQTVSGTVGTAAKDAFYRFTLGTTNHLNLSLSNLTADADLQLLQDTNNNGAVDLNEVITGSSQPGTQAETIDTSLTAGTYFIHVYQYSGDTSYTLSATATPIPQPPGYSNTYGYGLVNAGNAVADAIGLRPLPHVLSTDSNAWELNQVNAPAAWAQGYTGQGVVVAVVDTGVDITHPDLKANIWTNPKEIPGNGIDDDKNGFVDDVNGWDFVDRDNTPLDLTGHGTHVAGTIAAARNGIGTTGVAYNAKIMPVRVIGSDGGNDLDIAAGIRYAADNGANVINLSLGGSTSTAITDAVQYATTQKGALVVMASGNDGGSQPVSPANLASQWGLAVGAIDINQQVATFSDRAGAIPLKYVVAPGVNVVSTTPNNTYQSYSGTSMATPHVSGVAALVLSANPKLTPAQVTSLLTADATVQGLTVV